jgi:hypothetical protein
MQSAQQRGITSSRYAYAGCNPANNVDPSGLDLGDDCLEGALIGGLIGTATGASGLASD